MQIAIALFDGVEELDWAGPWEVLSYWAKNYPDDGVEVFTVAETTDPITCAKGMRVLPHHSWDEITKLDILVFPGGQGTRRLLTDTTLLDRLGTLANEGTLMTSVCTGSLVYAAAGLLHNRPATTHWAALDELTALDSTLEVCPDDRYVDAGAVITAAGVSAGIDMALHLIVREHSEGRAREVKRGIQYEPKPPV